MDINPFSQDDRVLVLGATGFIGQRLVRALIRMDIKTRLMVRSPRKAESLLGEAHNRIEIVQGDIFDRDSLSSALSGVHSAYYLIHSMGGKSITVNREFIEKDKEAAQNFIASAEQEKVQRVLYLGGLGEKGDNLSEHLKSRLEVGEILSSSQTVAATLFRAAVIIGAGGASYEILRHLVERLPVMICPKWVDTKIQPIAVQDVIAYLTGCLQKPETAHRTFDICGPDVLTYREMMNHYADARGLARRFIISVPLLTPHLSSYWVDFVTPVPSGVAHPLIEGLKNEVVCKDNSIQQFVPLKLTSFEEAVRIAHSEESTGPGVTGF